MKKQMVVFGTAAAMSVVLMGCAVPLDSAAQRVRLIERPEASACKSLGVVTADQQLGPNKSVNAMNTALNEVARRGGNAMVLVQKGTSGIDGVAVVAEAFACGG